MTDFHTVQAILAGDTEAYAELVRAHQDRVLRVCFSLLYNRAEAEDAAQDAFVKAYEALQQYRRDLSFPAWLCRIATNHCLDILRARQRRRTDSLDALTDPDRDSVFEPVDPSDDGTKARSREDQLVQARQALALLSPEYRQVLLLREVEGLSYEDIQAVLDCSLDTVKSRLKRARQDLLEKARHLFPDETFTS